MLVQPVAGELVFQNRESPRNQVLSEPSSPLRNGSYARFGDSVSASEHDRQNLLLRHSGRITTYHDTLRGGGAEPRDRVWQPDV